MKTERGTTIDLITKTGLFFLLLFSLLYGCSSQLDQSAEKTIQASLNAVGTKPDRDKIQNLVSLADCISANGKYTTEMHTASGGYSYFNRCTVINQSHLKR